MGQVTVLDDSDELHTMVGTCIQAWFPAREYNRFSPMTRLLFRESFGAAFLW